jgi:hypothetical protein
MRRKSVLLGLGIVVLVGGIAGILLLLLRHEPEIYRKTALPIGPQRKKRSEECVAEFCHVYNYISSGEREWTAEFTQDQINSYFEEDFIRSGLAERNMREGIREPRVVIEPERLRLAFRYGMDPWSTVISIDLGMWLTKKEPNVVALEVRGLHAGALPITAQSILERITDAGRGHDVEVSWYRLPNGNPVALLRFQADQKNPTIQLSRLQLFEGRLVVGGRSLDATPVRAMLEPLAIFKPIITD